MTTTDAELADLAQKLLRDDAGRLAREMLAPTDRAGRRQCDGCWKFRPLRPWPLGRRIMLCDRCWCKRVRGEIVRSWSGKRVDVATTHPVHGVLRRGVIHFAAGGGGWRMRWRVADHDGHDLGEVVGDYVDAQARLLDATGWADEIETDDYKDYKDYEERQS